MECVGCGAETLVGIIAVTKEVPLAKRNGTIKVGGVKIGQLDLKEAWDTEVNTAGEITERVIRGPIRCTSCETPHFCIVAAGRTRLFIGDYAEALETGPEAFLEE